MMPPPSTPRNFFLLLGHSRLPFPSLPCRALFSPVYPHCEAGVSWLSSALVLKAASRGRSPAPDSCVRLHCEHHPGARAALPIDFPRGKHCHHCTGDSTEVTSISKAPAEQGLGQKVSEPPARSPDHGLLLRTAVHRATAVPGDAQLLPRLPHRYALDLLAPPPQSAS